MGSLLAVADPEGIIKTCADDVRVQLAAVAVIYLSLKGITETIVGHAFQLGDRSPVSFQSWYAVGMAEDFYSIDFNVKFFFFGSPGFRAVLSELLLEPFIDSFPFFEDHQDTRGHRFRLECRGKALIRESTGASPAVREPEWITRVLFPDLDVVIDDFFDKHDDRCR